MIKFFGILITAAALIVPAGVFAQVVVSAPVQPSCILLTRDLEYGKRDAVGVTDIVVLQTFLGQKGYLDSEATGYFGGLTLAAVKKFQAAYKVPSTGYVGRLTRQKIYDVVCPPGTVIPTPVTTNPGSTSTLAVIPTDTTTLRITGVTSVANLGNRFYGGDKVALSGVAFPSNPVVKIGEYTVPVEIAGNQSIIFKAPSTIPAGTYSLFVTSTSTVNAPKSNSIDVVFLSSSETFLISKFEATKTSVSDQSSYQLQWSSPSIVKALITAQCNVPTTTFTAQSSDGTVGDVECPSITGTEVPIGVFSYPSNTGTFGIMKKNGSALTLTLHAYIFRADIIINPLAANSSKTLTLTLIPPIN